MSKKIVYATVSDLFVSELSKFHRNYITLARVSCEHSATIKGLEAERDDIIAKRAEAMKSGKTADEAIREFSTLEIDNKIRAARVKRDEEVKPLRTKNTEIISAFVPEALYAEYVKYVKSGNDSALACEIKRFFDNAGIVYQSDLAVSKSIKTLFVGCAGLSKVSFKKVLSDGQYMKEKNARQFNEAFILTICQILISDKNVLDRNADGSLSRHVYEETVSK